MPYRHFPRPPTDRLRERIIGVLAFLTCVNALAWGWALAAFAGRPVLVATAVLAYSLGLRQTLDADHIAAIDNVTRKLMQDGKRPVTVGFFFALGHSAVVLLASVAIALAANSLTEQFGSLSRDRRRDRYLGVGVVSVRHRTRQSGGAPRSLPGFSAGASSDVPVWSIFIFPVLFAAAMTLVDTLDGILMLGADGWAYRNPIRKLFYNITIMSVSLAIGGIETLGLMVGHFGLEGRFWNWISGLNANFGAPGYGIVAPVCRKLDPFNDHLPLGRLRPS
jgi:high-affinity nickel permease